MAISSLNPDEAPALRFRLIEAKRTSVLPRSGKVEATGGIWPAQYSHVY
jgi:TATA-box binding protein (TBP) (component of TFIID and TFIIIB)